MPEKKPDDPCRVVTPEFRVSFPAVFAPRAMEGAEPKYQLTMLFPKTTDLSALKRAASAAVTKKWGDKRPAGLRSPFLDGDSKDYDGYKGSISIKATSSTAYKPKVVDEGLQPIIDDEQFYAGCYARAEVFAFAYERNGNRGVAFSFSNVQKLRDGERFGGSRNPEDVFKPVPKMTPANDDFPTDEIPSSGGNKEEVPF